MGVEISKRIQCPACAAKGLDKSKNNLAIYEDGKFCQACGYTDKPNNYTSLVAGDLIELKDRNISLTTCEKYNVRTVEYNGFLSGYELNKEALVIFPIYENGKVVKQKLRSKTNKSVMTQLGKTDSSMLFGQNAFSPNKQIPVIVTEGEYDALSMYQMTGLPSVSIVRGIGGAYKELLANLEWLSGFKEVLLCFDMDEHGREGVEKCIPLFEPGTVRNVTLPLKDANDMLKAGRQDEIKKLLWNAEIIKPKTIVFPCELEEEVLTRPAYGTPWPWEFMTKVTYGNRRGEVYMLAADSSIGKTQFVYEIVANHISNGCKVGLIDLERQNVQTMQRIIGGILNKRIYLPDCTDFDKKEIAEQLDKLKDSLALYRTESGKLSVENILINIRYLAKAYKMDFFVIDNLTALASCAVGVKDHEAASQTTGQLVQLAKELNVTIFIVNHLVKDPISLNADITMPDGHNYNAAKDGLTWETGRIPGVGHIYGGGKVAKLPDYLIVLARNRMSTDKEIQRTLIVKFLKTRMESSHEGEEFKLQYDYSTGKLVERRWENEQRSKYQSLL